ncbi:nicotinate-nucleotide adenylyltransferase [Salirhabdus salicampi]|uniref:nicotinate-nucleotide adenylyltransferase n=1 Tax=Salirhabdus salicampi TaxID=476102 RepID=UPI0020C54AD1|nr:nicotinate-nucleotide adenylyltransferase [Salirhabdus salicampi]MCP8616932.1 nicotinate-nucleotide adenylyltransferase [Salirhabdus salicampi]
MKKVGLYGGTFDPPHLGHLIMAEEVREQLQLDEIWFIPTGVPPHKGGVDTPAKHRLKMVELSIKGNRQFRMEPIEVNREGVSYTVDTVKTLKQKHPEVEFYFIIGADMVEYLSKWYKIDDLLVMVRFVGVNRKGHRLKSEYPVLEVTMPTIEISSTEVKKRLKEGRTISYFVPFEVKQYIRENGLYGFK